MAAPAIIRPSKAWFPHGAVAACPAPAAPQYNTTSGDPLLDNSRFVPFVKFFGDASNFGTQVDQAYSGPLNLTPPWFAIGFQACLDYLNFGSLFSYSSAGAACGMPVAYHGAALALFNHGGGPETVGPGVPFIFGGGAAAVNINQWSCLCFLVPDAIGHTCQMIMDGVAGPLGTDGAGSSGGVGGAFQEYPPAAPFGIPSNINFGSWVAPSRGSMSDPDALNGGIRNWAVVQGTPTMLQIESFRSGTDPRTIWGTSTPSGSASLGTQTWSNGVIGYWAFTSDPRAGGIAANATVGATEPDLTGNGNTLQYFNGSSDANGVLPQLMTCQT